MSGNTFKPGDIVRLKSGGMLMTVSVIKNDGSVGCVWQPPGTTETLRENFRPEALEIYRD